MNCFEKFSRDPRVTCKPHIETELAHFDNSNSLDGNRRTVTVLWNYILA